MQMCDICQEVCPFNSDRGDTQDMPHTPYNLADASDSPADTNMSYMANMAYSAAPHGAFPTAELAFEPRRTTVSSNVTDLRFMTQEEFRHKFKGSPVKRAKRRGLLRNAATALAARDDVEAIAALEHAMNDPEEVVRNAAGWALEQIRARCLRARVGDFVSE